MDRHILNSTKLFLALILSCLGFLYMSSSASAASLGGSAGGPASSCVGSCQTSGTGGGGSGPAYYWELHNVSKNFKWPSDINSTVTSSDGSVSYKYGVDDTKKLIKNGSGRCGDSSTGNYCATWYTTRKTDSNWSYDIHNPDPWGVSRPPTGDADVIVAWNIKIWRHKPGSTSDAEDGPIFERRVGLNVSETSDGGTGGISKDTDPNPRDPMDKYWWFGGKTSSASSGSFSVDGESAGPLGRFSSAYKQDAANCQSNWANGNNGKRNSDGNVTGSLNNRVKSYARPARDLFRSNGSAVEGGCYWEGSQIGSQSNGTQFGAGPDATTTKGLKEAIRLKWKLPLTSGKAATIDYRIDGRPDNMYLVQIVGITNRERIIGLTGAADDFKCDGRSKVRNPKKVQASVANTSNSDKRSGCGADGRGDNDDQEDGALYITRGNYYKLFVPNPTGGPICIPGISNVPGTICDTPNGGKATPPAVGVNLEVESPLQTRTKGKQTIKFEALEDFGDKQAFFPRHIRLQHFTPQMAYNGAKNVADGINSYSQNYVRYDDDMGESLRSIPDPRPGPAASSSGVSRAYLCQKTGKVYSTSSALNNACPSASGRLTLTLADNGKTEARVCKSASTPQFVYVNASYKPVGCTDLVDPAYYFNGIINGSSGEYFPFLNISRQPQVPRVSRAQGVAGTLSENDFFASWLRPTLTNPCYDPGGGEAQLPDRNASLPWATTPAQCNTAAAGSQTASTPQDGTVRNAWDDYFSAKANWERRWVGEISGTDKSTGRITNQWLRCYDQSNPKPDSSCSDRNHPLQAFARATDRQAAQGYVYVDNSSRNSNASVRVRLGTNAAHLVSAAAIWDRTTGEIVGPNWKSETQSGAFVNSAEGFEQSNNSAPLINTTTNLPELNFCDQGIPATSSTAKDPGDNYTPDGKVRTARIHNHSGTAAKAINGNAYDPDSEYYNEDKPVSENEDGSSDCKGYTVKWNWNTSPNYCTAGDGITFPNSASFNFPDFTYNGIVYADVGTLRNLVPTTPAEASAWGAYGYERGRVYDASGNDVSDMTDQLDYALGKAGSKATTHGGTNGAWVSTDEANGQQRVPPYVGQRPGTKGNYYGNCAKTVTGFYKSGSWGKRPWIFQPTSACTWSSSEPAQAYNNMVTAHPHDYVQPGPALTTALKCSNGKFRYGYWYAGKRTWSWDTSTCDTRINGLNMTNFDSATSAVSSEKYGPKNPVDSGGSYSSYQFSSGGGRYDNDYDEHAERLAQLISGSCTKTMNGYTVAGDWRIRDAAEAGWGNNNTGPRIPKGGYTASFSFNTSSIPAMSIPNYYWNLRASYDGRPDWRWYTDWQQNEPDSPDSSDMARVYSPRDTR